MRRVPLLMKSLLARKGLQCAEGVCAGDSADLTLRRRGVAPLGATVAAIWQINAVFNGLLLAAAADGGVRVWRDYTFPRTQKLATAWQVGRPPPAPSNSGRAGAARVSGRGGWTPNHAQASSRTILSRHRGAEVRGLERSSSLLAQLSGCTSFRLMVLAAVDRLSQWRNLRPVPHSPLATEQFTTGKSRPADCLRRGGCNLAWCTNGIYSRSCALSRWGGPLPLEYSPTAWLPAAIDLDGMQTSPFQRSVLCLLGKEGGRVLVDDVLR